MQKKLHLKITRLGQKSLLKQKLIVLKKILAKKDSSAAKPFDNNLSHVI